jgi:hypothetical protein
VGVSAAAIQKQKQELQLLKEYEKFLSIVFNSLSKEISSIVQAVNTQISNIVMSKDREFFTEAVAKQYSNYSRFVDELFRSLSASFLLYI